MSVFCGDYATYYWGYGPAEFRSDFDCDDDVDDDDFDVMNEHYLHMCGASSQMVGEGSVSEPRWSRGVADTIRAAIPNIVLGRWLEKQLHPELRALLAHVRSLPEPARMGQGSSETVNISLLPRVTAISQNYPNPFGKSAIINYQVAPPGGPVRILIFDAAGRLVRILVDKETPPGYYSLPWDGKNEDGRQLPSGVYFYQMRAPGFESNKRMMLVR
jgi:hypothetical protein